MAGTYCKTCKYFLIETNAQMGSCRRFPTYQNRHSTEWCGEFAVVQEATLTLTDTNKVRVFSDLPDTIENLVAEVERKEGLDIAKPVDMPTTITLPKVDLELGVVMNPATDQTEKKKPGRPKLSGRQIP